MNRVAVSVAVGLVASILVGSRLAASEEGPSSIEEGRVDALESLVKRAYRTSPRLARSVAGAEVAAAGARKARSALFPNLVFQERFTSTNQPSAAFGALLEQGRIDPQRFASLAEPDRVENWAATLSAGMVLFDSGRSWNAWSAALEEAARAEVEAEEAKRRVRYEVAVAFYDLLRARAQVRVWAETIRAFEARREAVRARFEVGEVLRADLLSVEVRLGEAKEGEISARHAVEIARAVLAEAVGVPYDDVDAPPTELERPRYDVPFSRIVELSLAKHPRLVALEHARSAAEAALRAASRAAFPRLRGEIAGLWNGDDEAFGFDRDSYVGGIVLELPVFEGGRLSAEREEAAARLREVEAAVREARAMIELESRRADRRAREAVALIGLADDGAEAASEALDVLAARYGRGMIPIETLLELDRDRTRARARSVEARAGARIAVEAVRLVAGEEAFR
jgi:outer membrane protein